MSKGKKFDAHAKHFEELRVQLRKECKEIKLENTYLQIDIDELTRENRVLAKRTESLENENARLRKCLESFKETRELSDEDFRNFLEGINTQRNTNNALDLLSSLVLR